MQLLPVIGSVCGEHGDEERVQARVVNQKNFERVPELPLSNSANVFLQDVINSSYDVVSLLRVGVMALRSAPGISSFHFQFSQNIW